MNLLEYINCPFCNSRENKRLFTGKDYQFSKEDFSVLKCASCELVFTNPRVPKDKISSYYPPNYTSYKFSNASSHFKKIKKCFGYSFGNYYWKILKELKKIKAKNVLEIGPGNGDLLKFLQGYKFNLEAVEFDERCAQKIKESDITCHCGEAEDVLKTLQNEGFDAIIMTHVLEHFYDPKKVLFMIHNLLAKNGILYLTLPDASSLEARLFGKYWKGYDLPRHIIHYDAKSIKKILNNFKIKSFSHQLFPSSFIESIGFLMCKNGKMPPELYFSLYLPMKLMGTLYTKIIGSGVMEIIATKS